MIDFDHLVLWLSPRIVMGSIWPDLSRYVNNGRIYGAELRHGMMYFNGENAYISLPDILNELLREQIAVFFRFIPLKISPPKDQHILNLYKGTATSVYIEKDTNNLHLYLVINGTTYNPTLTHIQPNELYAVGWSYNGSQIRAFVNDTLVYSVNVTGTIDNFTIGNTIAIYAGINFDTCFQGYIGELFVWNRGLNDDKLHLLYELTSPYGTR